MVIFYRTKRLAMRKKTHFLHFGVLLFLLYILARVIDHHYPPDLSRYRALSPQISDARGELLRVHLSADEQYRLAVGQLPRHYRAMLIAYEDRRFLTHPGIDPLAIIRAAWQNLSHGRTVSGASTLTMQTARLLEPRPRTFKNKLIEAFRAWQLERRYSKDEILHIYATLAPMGGNRSGIETAARYYFGKGAAALSTAESAWLIALPQSPNRLKNPDKAQAAAVRVLELAHARGAIDRRDYQLALADNVRPGSHPFPALARHYLARHPDTPSSIDARLQQGFEHTLSQALPGLPAHVTLAALLVDNDSGAVRAYVGNADYFSVTRRGAVDILSAIRSPGSTLKPFVYLAAFSRFHYRPDTLIDDTPISESPWRPRNYDKRYLGRISLADALRQSRNIPAVRLMMELDAGEFASHLARHHLTLHFPGQSAPTPALILGGVGVRASELAQLYRELALCTWRQPVPTLASKNACAQTTRILRHVADIRYGAERVALKTGTAYGWRDQWLIGYSKRYTLLLWRGRADGGFAEERDSSDLLPIYHDLWALLPDAPLRNPEIAPLPPRPRPLAIRQGGGQQRFAILVPADGSSLELSAGQTLNLRAQHGKAPYQWFVNGHYQGSTTIPERSYRPQGSGHYHLEILDAKGERASIRFHIQPPPEPAPPVVLNPSKP